MRDAFFELVAYPVRGAALANERYFATESYAAVHQTDSVAAGADYTRSVPVEGVAWKEIPGIGRWGNAVALFPTTAASIDSSHLATLAPRLEFAFQATTTANALIIVQLLPTQSLVNGRPWRIAVAIDDEAPRMVSTSAPVDSRAWSQAVLSETLSAIVPTSISAGTHVLKVYMVDAGVVLDRIIVDLGGLTPSFLGPPETRR
ncbi:hypothetical protein BH09GEM1_BH09GEM1_05560 [soil metagenome]